MPSPRVTVVLPAKDAAPFLDTTLTTLARQFDDLRDVKLVAIDDGSRDGTGEAMRRHAAHLPHAEVIVNPQPVGLASARNQGLARVDTDLYCFLDGDDWMAPLRLQTLADAMEHLGCDFVRTDHITVTETRRQLVRAPYPWRNIACPPRDGILPSTEVTMVDYPYAWAGMMHRRLIDDGVAEFPEGLFTAEDRPWIWNLHLSTSSFAVVDAPALLYRRGVSTSLTQVHDRRQLDFVPAFAQALEIVTADRDADRFLPKLVTTILAVSAHHLNRSMSMPWDVRRDLRRGVRDLLRPVPRATLELCLDGTSQRRRRLLAPYVRRAA
ncbi:glycosyltransferase family 2 protein [Microbacterium sp. bgisy189]|uniref:glycosyltransferase family 2 protein n=1 Tax=Microbacterium sp. bgisy189 TaxID=3413798 RepID=UPI003EBCC03E